MNILGHIISGHIRALHQLVDVLLDTGNIRAHAVGQIGLEKRRADATDGDAVVTQFLAQGFGQGDYAGLGDIVAVHHGGKHQTGHGGDVDDGALALFLQLRGERLAATHHAHDVDVDDPFPVGDGGVFDGACGGDPGVVDDDVDAAPLFHQFIADFFQVAEAAHIALDEVAFATGLVDLLLDFNALLRVDIADAYPCAVFGIPQRNRPTQAAGPAGNKYSLCHRAFVLFCFVHWACGFGCRSRGR